MEEKLFSSAKARDLSPRLCCLCSYLDTDEKRFVLLTDSGLEVYSEDGEETMSSYSWFDVTRIYFGQNMFSINFRNEQVKFKSDGINQINNILADILPRILKPTELLALGHYINDIERAHPTPISALLRLHEKIKAKKLRASESTIRRFENILRFGVTCIDFSLFERPDEAIPLFFDIMPLCTEVTSIKVHHIKEFDVWQALARGVNGQGYIEHIYVDAPCTRNFGSFLRYLNKSSDLPISGLTFCNTKLTDNNLRVLSKCLIDKKIRSLGFVDALQYDSMPFFYNNIMNNTIGYNLRFLCLDRTNHVNLEFVTEKVPSLEMLSAAYCSLDINDIFSMLSTREMPSLVSINLSGNICTKKIAESYSLPRNLSCVVLEDVKWSDQRFVEFFRYSSFAFVHSLRLAVSRAVASGDEWNRVFSELNILKISHLNALIWDSNPINDLFFNFLSRNTTIDYLSMNNCLPNNNVVILSKFTKYISQNKTLKSLIIRGGSDNFLGNNFIEVCDALVRSESIEHLDISNNSICDNGLVNLRAFESESSKVKLLCFDGSDPRDPKYLFDLLYNFAGNKKEMVVSFPLNDLTMLLDMNIIDKGQFDWICDRYQHPQPTINEIPSTFELPFEIYVEPERIIFPLYLRSTSTPESYNRTEDAQAYGSQARTEYTVLTNGDEVRLIPKQHTKRPKRLFELSRYNNEYDEESVEVNAPDSPIKRARSSMEPLFIIDQANMGKIRRKSDEFIDTMLPKSPRKKRLSFDLRFASPNAIGTTRISFEQSALQTARSPATDLAKKKKRRRSVLRESKNLDIKPLILEEKDLDWSFPIIDRFNEQIKHVFSDAERANDLDSLLENIPRV